MACPFVPITQINLHHSRSASAILARSMAVAQTKIALIQEPWLVKNAIKGLGGCGTIHKARPTRKLRTCILTKGINATFLPQLSCDDLTVVQTKINLTGGGSMDLLIGSAYMPYDSTDPPPQEEINNLVTYANVNGLQLLLGCDANSHHTSWGSSGINSRGESLHNFILSTGLIILNRGTEPTFMDSRRQEVLDITICTKEMADLVRDWRVSNEPSGSDHRQICFALQHSPTTQWVRNPRNTNWEGFRGDLASLLALIPNKFSNKEDLEMAAQSLSNAIIDAYETNCPLKLKNNSKKAPWWNSELTKLRAILRRLLNRAKNSRFGSNHWEAYRKARNEYSKAIVKAKRKSWKEYCESVEKASEASRLNKILSTDSRPQLGCLKRPDGVYTNNTEETLKLLMETHFPGFQESPYPTAAGKTPERTYKPKEWTLAAKVVYPKAVEWAINTFDPYKSPGQDGIHPVLLQKGIGQLLGPLTKVLRASIALRHVPQAWNGARVTFIPKAGKNGHILAKDYRPISLTSFLLKTLERLVDSYLKDNYFASRPLACPQYAYREGRSTDIALHHLVSTIETQLVAKGYALGVFLDIEGAFDTTSYSTIREAMAGRELPEALIDWTLSMLSNRALTVYHGGVSLSGIPARGCPQGGVISPLLWSIVVDELLIELQNKSFSVYGYADDVAIIVRGNFLTTLKELMDNALKITQDWCLAKGLSVNPAKTKAMIFTRKYKPEPIERLKLWGKEIEYSLTVKYLGAYLDPKLNWKHHLESKRTSFYSSMWACRRAMGKTWGLKPRVALWLYKAVLLPRLTYAAVVWWPRAEKVEAKNLLKSLQGNYLRAVTGVMKTTPIEGLEVALCCPPLERLIVYTARLSAYRIKCLGEWKQGRLKLTELSLLYKRPFTLNQDRIPRKFLGNKSYKIQIPSRDDWKNSQWLDRFNADTWFTDGSGANESFGAGIYCPKTNLRLSIPLGQQATVFQAEMLAILECAKLQNKQEVKQRNILICSDSRAALDALAKTTTESSVVWDCMRELDQLGKANKITLMWSPGHQGIPGNEEADGLAKLGTLERPEEPTVGVPFAVGKKILRDQLGQEHEASWNTNQGCRQAKTMMKRPLHKRTHILLAMSRRNLRTSIGLLTGHTTLRAHLYILGLAESKECRLCGEEPEDVIHITCRCPALAATRHRLLGRAFIEPGDLPNLTVSDLFNMARNAGLLTDH